MSITAPFALCPPLPSLPAGRAAPLPPARAMAAAVAQTTSTRWGTGRGAGGLSTGRALRLVPHLSCSAATLTAIVASISLHCCQVTPPPSSPSLPSQPLWDVVPYEEFSLRLPRSALHSIGRAIDDVSPQQLAELQRGVDRWHRCVG